MTLPQIAAEIDVLIERYTRARTILATLVVDSVDLPKKTRETKGSVRPEPLPSPAVPQEVLVTVLPPHVPRHRQRSAPVRRPEPTALSSLVPQEVVVIPAVKVLQRIAEQEKTMSSPAEPSSSSGHTLDDLVSALQSRGMAAIQLH